MGFDWLTSGEDARKEVKAADANDEERKKSNVFRFWMPSGKETSLTFLDGKLDASGKLHYNTYHEHQLYLNGNWRNWYTCSAVTNPETGDKCACPICEQGDNYSIVSPFTVIDHSEYTDKKGVTHKDQVKLFIAKRGTLKLLELLAVKRKGLVGCTFDVMRPEGDQVPSVGGVFDFTEKHPVSVLRKKYGVKGPLDYGTVIPFRDEATLRKMGFGLTAVGGPGESGAAAEEDDENWDDDIPF